MYLIKYCLSLFAICFAATLQKELALPDSLGVPFSPPTVSSVSFSGNGCPQNGGKKTVSGGWRHFSFTLPDFAASYGGIKPTSVNCEAHMRLVEGEPGWRVALKDVWIKGHLALDPATKLSQTITTYYSDNAANTVCIWHSEGVGI